MNNTEAIPFTIISRPYAIGFDCPHCEINVNIPWADINPPVHWGDSWPDIECPDCGKTVELGEWEYE